MAIRLFVRGDHACFPRPEFARDRISYDIPTPRAARDILDGIHAAPDFWWQVDAIHLLRPVRFREVNIAALAVGDTVVVPIARAHILVDVAFMIEARFVSRTASDGGDEHLARVRRNVRAQTFLRPLTLGLPAFKADVALSDAHDTGTAPKPRWPRRRDFGWMLHDSAPADVPRFFRAVARRGVVHVPPPDSTALAV